MPERDIMFKKCRKMCVVDFAVQGVQKVIELLRMCWYPSYLELMYMLRDGNVVNLLSFMVEVICRAYEIHGKSAEFVRGRMSACQCRG
jgi:hypothetical protein